MLKSSDEYVRKIFQSKLKDFEAEAPEGSSDVIFSELKKSENSAITKFISGALLLTVLVLFTYEADQPHAEEMNMAAITTAPYEGSTEQTVTRSFAYKNTRPAFVSKGSTQKALAKKDPARLFSMTHQLAPAPRYPATKAPNRLITGDKLLGPLETVTADDISFVQTHDTIPEETDRENSDRSRSIHFLLSVTPFVSYNRIVPNRDDAAHLSNFKTPSRFSTKRVGFKISAAVEYSLTSRKSLLGGLSYFKYNTQFDYSANEVLQRLSSENSVDETTQGVSVMIGGRHVLGNGPSRHYYVQGGADFQYLINRNESASSHTAMMMFAGVGRECSWKNYGIRIQPIVYYSLTRFHYGGLQSQPYWIGLDLAYIFKR